MGTRIKNLQVTKVVDGDTIKVKLKGKEESLRLVCMDTEESWAGGSKPVTNAGLLAKKKAEKYFTDSNKKLRKVNIEFDTDDPVDVCLTKHRGNYGRLLCYVERSGTKENFNLYMVREGYSPYLSKYGRSRLYHKEFVCNEAHAMAEHSIIWNPETNAGGKTRDYSDLLSWWGFRAQILDDYRAHGVDAGVLSVRLDYDEIVARAKNKKKATILCDLQGGVSKWAGGGALIYAGSITHKFNLWIPDRESPMSQKIINLIETRYGGHGRGYVYITGKLKEYGGKPEFVLDDVDMMSDFPPGK